MKKSAGCLEQVLFLPFLLIELGLMILSKGILEAPPKELVLRIERGPGSLGEEL